jgi:hypothetical protein
LERKRCGVIIISVASDVSLEKEGVGRAGEERESVEIVRRKYSV